MHSYHHVRLRYTKYLRFVDLCLQCYKDLIHEPTYQLDFYLYQIVINTKALFMHDVGFNKLRLLQQVTSLILKSNMGDQVTWVTNTTCCLIYVLMIWI